MNKVKITLNKKKFDFHFGLGFFGELKENQGIGIEDVQKGLKDNPFKIVPKLMLEAAKYSAMRRGAEFKYGIYDFIDAIDADGGISAPAFIEFLEALTNSMTKDVPKEEDTKKKVKPKK